MIQALKLILKLQLYGFDMELFLRALCLLHKA